MVRDSLVDQGVMFTHLYLMQVEKIEAWFLSPTSREYFGVESTAFLSVKKFTKNLSTEKISQTSIREAIKIALSFSKF